MPVQLPELFAIFLLLDLLCWWGLDRILVRSGAGKPWRAVLAAFMIFHLASLIIVPGAQLFHISPPPPEPGEAGMSLVFLWDFLALPFSCLLAAGYFLTEMVRGRLRKKPTPAEAGRRRFLALAGPALAVSLTGVALYQLSRFRVRRMTVDIPDLPPALEGFTITHVSDIHLGRLTHGDILDDLVEQVNALNADVIAFTGDLIDFYQDDLPEGLRTLSRLKSRHGVFACEGNHDLFQNGDAFRDACLKWPDPSPVFLFQDQRTIDVQGQPVQFLGIEWLGHSDDVLFNSVREVAAKRDPGAFPILLAHHPHAFDHATGAGFPLTLSGHTHGGQLMLTKEIGWGPVMFRYWSGLYRQGKSRLVVSNGVGNWFPLRVGAEAEVVHLTLRGVA